MVRFITLAATVIFVTLQYAAYAVDLGEINPSQVEEGISGPFVVEYFSPNCKHCEDFKPKWNHITSTHNDISFGRINCGLYSNYCKEKGMTRFPTIQANVNNGEWKEYSSGDFSIDRVNDFIKNSIVTRNENGKIVELTTAKQLEEIRKSKEPWFVKFYAPWCGHCKHLAPVWTKLANNLKYKINIAEVNCEESKSLCQQYNVTGLPTLTYFVHGTSLKYDGKRELDDLETYAKKLSDSPVITVETDDALGELLKKQDVTVVYVRSPKDTGKYHITAVEKSAPEFIATIPFYATTNHKTITRFSLVESDLPAVVIAKDGTHYTYTEKNLANLASWIRAESSPLVTHIFPHNSNKLLMGDRLVVLGITDPNDEDSTFKLRSMAQVYKEEHEDKHNLIFAQLDGKTYSNYVNRIYGISSNKMPSVIVLDPKKQMYYDRHADASRFLMESPNEIFASIEVLDTLLGTSTAPSKSITAAEKLFVFIEDHWIIVTTGLFGLLGVTFWIMLKDEPIATEKIKETPEKTDSGKKQE